MTMLRRRFGWLLHFVSMLFFFSFFTGEITAFAVSRIAKVQFMPENIFTNYPNSVVMVVNVFSKVFRVNLVHSSSVAPYIHSKSPTNPINCHYEGYVSSYEKSDAAFSLCSPDDANGAIWLNEKVFMVMSTCSDRQACMLGTEYNFTVYGDLSTATGQSHSLSSRNFLLQRARRDVYAAPSSPLFGEPPSLKILGENDETLYIRLLVASDPQQFSNNNNIKSQTERRAMQIANVAALLMRPLNIVLYVMEHRVLTSRDVYAPNIKDLLSQVQKYRSANVDANRTDIDVVHLLTSSKFDPVTAISEDADLLGQAYVSGICSRYAVSFSADLTNSIVQVGATMAHEIGHLLGLPHDKTGCVCPFSDLSDSPTITNSSQCIMVAAKAVSGSQPLSWSNCSIQILKDNRKRMPPFCLRQRPVLSLEKKFCGNGVVEEDEQCDCGSPDLVNAWASVAIDNVNQKPPCSLDCCDMNTCQFARKNVTCATGRCCNLDTCQVLPKYVECRKAANECDLPEYCSGTSENCPRDLHKATGYSCVSDPNSPAGPTPGVCFAGYCHSRGAQCRRLWGPTAVDGKDSCYADNRKGTEDANCGHQNMNFEEDGQLKRGRVIKKCPTIEDAYCGTLKCGGTSASTTASPLFIQPALSEIRNGCAWILAGMMPDYGLVRNGTKCKPAGYPETDGICLNNLCVSLNDTAAIIAATFEAEGLASEFSRIPAAAYPHGAIASGCGCTNSRCFCNSVGSRHCAPGYAPPACEAAGCGGSLESNAAGLCSRVGEGELGTGAVVAIAVLGTVFGIGIVVVILFLAVGRRRLSEMWYSSRLFVEVENLRERFTSIRRPSDTKSAQICRADGIRRSQRGPPGPAPITTVSSSNTNGMMEMKRHHHPTVTGGTFVHDRDVTIDIRRPNNVVIANLNKVGASPTLEHRVASAPVQRSATVATPQRPPPPKSAVTRPSVPPPPPPKPQDLSSPATPDDDNLPLSVADAAKRFGGGMTGGARNDSSVVGHANRTPPQDVGQWFSNVLKRNHDNMRDVNQSPVLQRQPMLEGDAAKNGTTNLQRRPSLGGTNPVQLTRVYHQ